MLIQITDVIPESGQHEELPIRQALVGLKVEADGTRVQGIRALNPNLARVSGTYEVASRDMFDALWNANRIEHSLYWEDIIRPHIFRIPYGCAKVMRSVRIERPPHFPGHPEQYVHALSAVEFLLDFDEIAAYFAGNPKQERPPTRFLPVPLSRIVTCLRQSGHYRAAVYWQNQWTLGFLAIPAENCRLYDTQ